MAITKKKPAHYVDNVEFLKALKAHRVLVNKAKRTKKDAPQTSEYLGECFLKIARHLSFKHNFVNYTFREDMISDGVENCLHRDTQIVTMEYGSVGLAQIEGQSVTVKAADGVWRPATVRSFGPQMLYRYRFGSFNTALGRLPHEVIATRNHRWFVQNRVDASGSFTGQSGVIDDLRLGDCLTPAITQEAAAVDGVVHGLIFGDGSINEKSASYHTTTAVVQGHEYPFMRVCKQDSVQAEIVDIFRTAGFHCTYPPSACGDPVFYLGRKIGMKQLPFTRDAAYIRGFIHGWWLADGSKTTNTRRLLISTVNAEAVEWAREYAPYAGYVFLSVRQTPGGSYPNAKPLFSITLAKAEAYDARLRSIEPYGVDDVFCVEEPVTHGFVLGNGLLTGNCLIYMNNFDPAKSSNPFGYFTQIIYFAFVRRIMREKKHTYIKYKLINQAIIDGATQFNPMEGNSFQVDTSMLNFDNVKDFINQFESYATNRRERRKKAKEPKEETV